MSSTNDSAGDIVGRAFTCYAFSEAVKRTQQQYGTRDFCRTLEGRQPCNDILTGPAIDFIHSSDSFLLGTANVEGWPHVQHRGGPWGFLKVLDRNRLAFGDFDGNQQLISVGNISENPKIHLLLIDYERRRRLKVWGNASVHPPRDPLIEALAHPAYRHRIARIMVIDVVAWDFNCNKHISARPVGRANNTAQSEMQR
jgi:predicted pyridoxine 5'-phosphate oxidase superfamily flavin-nucleotide-binding protein